MTELVTLLAREGVEQQKALLQLLIRLHGQIRASNDEFARDIRSISTKKWSRYQPLLHYVAQTYQADGFDERLIESAIARIINPRDKKDWSGHLAMALTVAVIVLAFLPPLWAVAAGIGIAGYEILQAGKKYHDALKENQERRKLTYGNLMVPHPEIVKIIEDPIHTDLLERALKIELMFAIPDLIAAPRVAKAIPAAIAGAKAKKTWMEVTPPPLSPHKSAISDAERGIPKKPDPGNATQTASDPVGSRGIERREKDKRPVITSIHLLEEERATRGALVAHNRLLEKRMTEMFGIENLSQSAPTSSEYADLARRRKQLLEKLPGLRPDEMQKVRKINEEIADIEKKMKTFNVLADARLNLPTMFQGDIELFKATIAEMIDIERRIRRLDEVAARLQSEIREVRGPQITDTGRSSTDVRGSDRRSEAAERKLEELKRYRDEQESQRMVLRAHADALARKIDLASGGKAVLMEILKQHQAADIVDILSP